MNFWELLLLLAVAATCGALGQAIAGVSRGGCLVSVAIGFIGAMIGMWLARAFKVHEILALKIGDVEFPIVWSILGATIFVAVISLVSRPKNP